MSVSFNTPVFADILEGVFDAPADITTPYTIAPGDTFTGTLDGDADYIAIDLLEGQEYRVDLQGTGLDAIGDTMLTLRDSEGTIMAQDDDGGAGALFAIAVLRRLNRQVLP